MRATLWSHLRIWAGFVLLHPLLCVYSFPLAASSSWRTPVKTRRNWLNQWQPMAQKSRKKNKSQNLQNHLSISMIKDQRYVWNKIVYQRNSVGQYILNVFGRDIVSLFPFLLCLISIYLNGVRISPLFDFFSIHSLQFLFLSPLTLYTLVFDQYYSEQLKTVLIGPWESRELALKCQSARYFFHWKILAYPLLPRKSTEWQFAHDRVDLHFDVSPLLQIS